MRNNILLLTLLLFVSTYLTNAQKLYFNEIQDSVYQSLAEEDLAEIERLDSAYKITGTDTAKLAILYDVLVLTSSYGLGKPINDVTLAFIENNYTGSLATIEDTLFVESWGIALFEQSAYHQYDGNYDQAIDLMKEALAKTKSIGDTTSIIQIYNALGYLRSEQDDESGALQFYFKAVEVGQNEQYESDLISTYLNIAYSYRRLDSLSKNLEYNYLALNLAQKHKVYYSLLSVYNNLGNIYFDEVENYDSSEYYINKGIILAEEMGDKQSLADAAILKTQLYAFKDDFVEAEVNGDKALELAEELDNTYRLVGILAILEGIKLNLGKYEEAHELLTRRIEIEEKQRKEDDIQSLSDLKAELKYEKELELSALKEENLKAESRLKSNILWVTSIALLLILSALFIIIINRRKLAASRKELMQLDRVNKQIFSVIAHDFKEPIISFNLLLNHIEKSKEVDTEFLQEMKSLILSSNQVLSNLLNWARAELEKQTVRKEKLNLKELWAKVLSNMDKTIDNKMLNIQNRIQENTHIEGDAIMLEIVFRNLLSNAIKFSPQGGTITLNASQNNIQIIDEGSGIDEEMRQKLFKEKVNSSYGTNGETGFGIGLYIVQNLLQKNNMTISYSPNTPKGSTFAIHNNKSN